MFTKSLTKHDSKQRQIQYVLYNKVNEDDDWNLAQTIGTIYDKEDGLDGTSIFKNYNDNGTITKVITVISGDTTTVNEYLLIPAEIQNTDKDGSSIDNYKEISVYSSTTVMGKFTNRDGNIVTKMLSFKETGKVKCDRVCIYNEYGEPLQFINHGEDRGVYEYDEFGNVIKYQYFKIIDTDEVLQYIKECKYKYDENNNIIEEEQFMQNVNINNILSDSDHTTDYKEITIKCSTSEEAMNILNNIHNNLVGNQDYIDSNIVLSDQFMDENTINVAIFEECTTDLDILSIKKK